MIPKLGISISYFAILFSSIKELEVATGYFQLLNELLGGRGRRGAQLRSSPYLLPPGGGGGGENHDVWRKSLPKVGWQNRRRRLFDKINVARQSDSKVAEL